MIRVFEDDLNDPYGTEPYKESPGIWICRQCAADIHHKDALCGHCKRAHQLEELLDREF